jgi:hypothetical protein
MKFIEILLETDEDKLIKRGETIYNALRKGTLNKGHFGKVVYILPNEYKVNLDTNSDIFIKVGNNSSDNNVRFYSVDNITGDYKEFHLDKWNYKLFIKKIGYKFEPFDITLWCDQND